MTHLRKFQRSPVDASQSILLTVTLILRDLRCNDAPFDFCETSGMTVSIKRWEPENIIFWLTRGRRIANRNLLLSTLALHLNFNVWMMWSIVVSNLPAVGFAMTGQQQFLLVSIRPWWVPSCACLCLHLELGGRRHLAGHFHLVPADSGAWRRLAGAGHQRPFPLLLLVAACCGIGGAASSSHLSNTSFSSQIGQGICHGAGMPAWAILACRWCRLWCRWSSACRCSAAWPAMRKSGAAVLRYTRYGCKMQAISGFCRFC
jgi:hypothetical protein